MSDHPGGQFPHPGQQPAWQNPPAPQGWQQPYPQQSYPQQPYPQQPYPPQQGWPQQQGWPAPPPKKKGMATRLKVLIAVGVLVVAGGTAWAAWVSRVPQGTEKQAVSLAEGDCAQVTGTGDAADAAKFPCDAPGTPYVVSVAGTGDGSWSCTEGFYSLVVNAVRAKDVGLCFGLNGQMGACFDDVDTKTPPPLVDCAKARYKVTQVFPSAAIVDSLCNDQTVKVVSYMVYGASSRFKSTTICLSTP
ncbi:LppU/SCO3897 family protein [Amycolatopsis sp.]|jgi:hypothetical protein|uniref:LppU/SCO3897 family protein n=1 Tax=Amycolatopsis sp. TaxID=37632 RepID=UPI002DFB7D82|nr:hypothetical protein [Amycolatopsis sp.]